MGEGEGWRLRVTLAPKEEERKFDDFEYSGHLSSSIPRCRAVRKLRPFSFSAPSNGIQVIPLNER